MFVMLELHPIRLVFNHYVHFPLDDKVELVRLNTIYLLGWIYYKSSASESQHWVYH